MSANSQKNGQTPRTGPGSLAGAPATASHLRDKVNVRTSTPDSEALASSDDEGDHRHESTQPAAQPTKPARRSSWLNDTSAPFARPRKGSIASGSMSPTASHPTTPSGETAPGTWGAHSASAGLGRAVGGSAFPWTSAIWNNDNRREPSRLSEVLPSPTSLAPPGATSNSMFGPDAAATQTSPNPRDGNNGQIPFAIPLHPTPKTYRSQSYSVGQMESEVNAPPSSGMSSSTFMGRARHPALQHRPSRPSMLSEMANDGSMLGKVKEVEDDDDEESTPESMQGSFHQSAESKTIEMLTRENAMLRQQQYNRLRPRASTGTSYFGNGVPLQGAVPEESDYAVDEYDLVNTENGESFARSAATRRMSEYGGGAAARSPSTRADSTSLKKALWSTSGYPLLDASQSRRHSFANMPTRHGSISSIADTASAMEGAGPEAQQFQEYLGALQDSSLYAQTGNGNLFNPMTSQMGANVPQVYGNPYQPSFASPHMQNRPGSPQRTPYGMAQPRQNQLLHVVLFKCARADVFYIQEGTGLTVKPGDLVIVEADRGTDLGTVAKDNVDWQTAKELKEHYAEEHYKWLMMYSQGAAVAQEGSGSGPGMLASSSATQGSAVGGMGPATQHHMQEPNAGELRPKLIKRLAQSHEVHNLREKEGQEAKAKRVCNTKVKEHGLQMEILDAEFQMDWKKLTFYYFADAYINFNSLVTDLFKIYKTRIWMSAINPASFASPTLGIQAPSGVGPGAVGAGRSSGHNDRRQGQQQPQAASAQQQPQSQQNQESMGATPTSITSQGSPAPRGFRPGLNQQYGNDRANGQSYQGYPSANYGYPQGGAFGNARTNAPYGQATSPGVMDNYSGANFQHFGDFQASRNRFASPQTGTSPNPHSQAMAPLSPMGQQNDWSAAFQGLSLNSH